MMVNSPAHHHHLLPLQREYFHDEEKEMVKADELNEVENSSEENADEDAEEMNVERRAEEEEVEVEEEVEDDEVEVDDDDYEDDEEEEEIQQLIQRSQHHLLNEATVPRRLPQSYSAHANLAIQGKRHRAENSNRESGHRLEINAEEEEEENRDQQNEEEEDEEEDSDEEFFMAHRQLLPLRKSKSAFAGFQSSSDGQQVTKPFACPVIVKRLEGHDEEEGEEGSGKNEIAELIDLRRGDVLKFRVAEHSKKEQRAAACSPSLSSHSSLDQAAGRTASCWSAPACPNESEPEFSSASEDCSEEEEDLEDEGRGGGGRRRRNKRHRSFDMSRKQSSWSAPSQMKWEDEVEVEVDEELEDRKKWEEKRQRKLDMILDDWERRKRSVTIQEEEASIADDLDDNEGKDYVPKEEEAELKWQTEAEEEEMEEGERQEGEEDEEDCLVNAEPTNIKCLEMEEQTEEVMSTGEDDEEEEVEDDKTHQIPTNGKHMRVFVSTNSQMVHHRRRHFPSSRSDSQLLWNRHSAPTAPPPPPPAPFPLEEGTIAEEAADTRFWKIGEMPHSRTYGGFLTSGGRQEDFGSEEDDEEKDREVHRKLKELEVKMNVQPFAAQQSTSKTTTSWDDHCGKEIRIHEDYSSEEEGELEQQREQREPVSSANSSRPANLMSAPMTGRHNPDAISTAGSDEIPMADDCPTPSFSLMPGYLPLPLGRKGHAKTAAAASSSSAHPDNSLSSSSYYSEEEEVHRDWVSNKGTRRRPLMQRSAAARLSRRGSPPLAQLDLMSESEISDLEQQIASGQLVKSYGGTPSGQQQLLDEDEEEEEEEEEKEEKEEKQKQREDEDECKKDEYRKEDEKKEEEECEESEEKRVEESYEEEVQDDEEDRDECSKEVRNDENWQIDGKSMDPEMEEDAQVHHQVQQQQMCPSSSMPTINQRNINSNQQQTLLMNNSNYWGPDYVPADFWRSEYPIGEESGWEEQQYPGVPLAGYQPMHRSLTVQSEFDGQTAPLRRRRRILPLRPDQLWMAKRQAEEAAAALTRDIAPSARVYEAAYQEEDDDNFHSRHSANSTSFHGSQIAFISPSDQPEQLISPASAHCLSLSFSGGSKRRQLPKTPSSEEQEAGEYPLEDPLANIDIATATKEYLLSVLHKTHQHRAEQQMEAVGREEAAGKDAENFDDYSPTVPVLPSPSVIQRPVLPLLPLHQQSWPHEHQHHQQQDPDKQYTLSYGMDQSAMRNARRGLSMEGSYYEDSMDGLNGNLTGAFYSARPDEGVYTPEEEEGCEKRRASSGYNLADGAKSSSGISSCCTTSSRSAGDPPETTSDHHQQQYQQQLMRRQQRGHQQQKGASEADDPSAPSHRVQFPFMPRHADELRLERGDALHVVEKFEDHWCFGLNLRSGQRGIFPEAHIIEIDLVDEICRSVLPDMHHQQRQERDTFYLTLLASIEVAHHKGNDVLVQAINKVCAMYQRKEEILVPQTVLMEVSFRGIHVIDKRKKDIFRCPTFDFFYSLQNISFCGAHPKELRYFGFITKHPLLPRFACHVFLSNESTQSIVEAIGRAFKRSYDEYMAFAHPTEDIFLE